MEYYTQGNVKILGESIVIDLTDAKLNSEIHDIHMTLIFGKKFTTHELLLIRSYIINYKITNNLSTIKFNLSKWGNESDLIHGELALLCLEIRKTFINSNLLNKQRLPHVKLRC